MPEEKIDLGQIELVQADAVGVPGARRFRLRAVVGSAFALLWVEREQTQALGNAIAQLLAQVQLRRNERRTIKADAGGPLDRFPPTPTVELTVGRLGIGYDDERDLVVIEAKDIEENLAGQEPADNGDSGRLVIFRCTRPQAAALQEQCETTLRSGRPRCPLCGAPMERDGSHFCIRANGHAGPE